MSHLMKGKKYGLSVPGKAPATTKVNPLQNSKMGSKTSIFGQDSSDSGEEGDTDWVKRSMQASKAKVNNSALKKQSKIVMAKALEEDPTVFQYDEVYDDMEKKKEEVKESKKEVDRKPKYMTALLKSADERQKEFERRVERQVQKEREAEGEQFKDKESFVTSAYRKKMEEIAKQEEEQARLDRIEAALDVTKQNNMDGFYRHLYRQTMGEEKGQVEERLKKEQPEEDEETKAAKIKEEMKKIKVEDDELPLDEPEDNEVSIKKIQKKKEVRKKNVADSSSEGDTSDEEDSNSDNGEKEEAPETAEDKLERRKIEMKLAKEKRERRMKRIEEGADSSESESEEEPAEKRLKTEENVSSKEDEKEKEEEPKVVSEIKPKINIWEKRTVGKVFEDAVARYWKRRAEAKGA